ncbi:MAG: ribonuclease HII [Hyphomicrobiaceae bacterium]|nr:ribonuclease HII [Hyphomicrobiaceae bacterium]
MNKSNPTLEIELKSLSCYGGPIVGVDEAGRGPLAGPVVAAAVAYSEKDIKYGLQDVLANISDSKRLSSTKRELLYNKIVTKLRFGIGLADRHLIDSSNILNATLWAMQEAVNNLSLTPSYVLIDGNRAPKLPWKSQTIIRGDARCVSIASASIVAKVTRDKLMCELAKIFPQYGFERHKGYCTNAHLEALRRHGICDAHRRSFRPVQLILQEKNQI